MKNKDGVLVVKGDLAKNLLQLGYVIQDLLPKKNLDNTYDYTRSVFIFSYKDGIFKDIDRLK